jgi:hypothetical protein
MMTLEELQSSTINAAVAREAYTQVDRYLLDILATRSSFEQKSTTLMSAFITISLALFGIGGAIFQKNALDATELPFFVAGFFFLLGAGCFIVALKVGTYAAVGSTPEMWLNEGVIDGPDNAVDQMLAYLTYYHRERIEISVTGNKLKAKWIDAGIILGAIGPVAFVLLFMTV